MNESYTIDGQAGAENLPVPPAMLLECPSCAAGYEVPERCRDRRVRCARCGEEWRAAGAEPDQAPPTAPRTTGESSGTTPGDTPEVVGSMPAAIDPEQPFPAGEAEAVPAARPVACGPAVDPEARPERAGPNRWNRAALALAACWMLTLGSFGGGGYAVLHWRTAIAHRWPPLQRAYALLPGPHVG